MKTFVAVMNIPSPYRLHLLGELARQLADRGIAFHCHFMNRGHKDRPKSWLNPQIDFPHTYWRNFGTDQHEFNPGLVLKLLCWQPDYMIIGSSFDTLTGTLIAWLNRKSIKCVWAEGNTKTPGPLYGFKGWFKRLIYSWFEFALVPGMDAVRYIGLHQTLTNRKMPTPDVLPNIVDETRFVNKNWTGLFDRTKVCIIPARLEQVKGLVPFFSLLNREILNGWRIKLMGQGALKKEIEDVIRRRDIGEFVEICDYVPYEEMPNHYAAADLLLLPSIYDPNPLSVVEALHTGLPVALSCMAGNVEEAVTEGRNGWVLPVGDLVAFADKLRDVFSSSVGRLAEMGKWSKEHNAQFWNSKRAVRKFIDVMVGEDEK